MAEFEAKVYRLEIEAHPNADALELARVGDYRSIVRKGAFKTGDLGVYIPEQAVCPDWLVEELGLTGKLAGKAKNRVKAIKLRGVLSQGLIYPVIPGDETFDTHILTKQLHFDDSARLNDETDKRVRENYIKIGVEEGTDVTTYLGIKKYEPVIPASMSGVVRSAVGCSLKYDIENIKKYPNVLIDGEQVYVTEKLHGTWCCFGYHPDIDHPIVASKGLSAQGLIFKWSFPENENNLYVRMFQSLIYRDINRDPLFECMLGTTLLDRMARLLADNQFAKGTPFYILGEIYGPGVQDLHYGETRAQFRAFDLFVGDPSSGDYVGSLDKERFFKELGIEQVPILYRGPFDRALVDELTNGKETVSGSSANVREGVVITPMVERRDNEIGRVILKSVSDDYLLRKGGTEFN